jgi:hypothetical protein
MKKGREIGEEEERERGDRRKCGGKGRKTILETGRGNIFRGG